MSHSLSSQVHSTKAASASNVSPLHHSGSTTVKVAPRSVLVNWSESSRLNEGEEFPFDIFEAIALKAALDNPLGGYDKTDITVNFDNGHQHRCRVDLGYGGNECGFADHCFRVLEYALSLEKSEPSHWYFTHAQHSQRKLYGGVTLSQVSCFTIDARLVHLFEKLAALNPTVGQIVAALNVVLAENGEKIVTREDFEQFLEQIEEWE